MDKECLDAFIKLSQVLNELDKRIGELEDTVEALDKNIEDAEIDGITKEIIGSICKRRNDIELAKIELAIQKNEIERSLLKFQRIRLLTK